MAGKSRKEERGLTGLEVLGVAIRAETEAHRFYTQALRGVQNPLLKEKLLRLAAEEKRHRQILEARYRKSSGEEFPPIPGKEESREKEDAQRPEPGRDPETGHPKRAGGRPVLPARGAEVR